MKRAASALLVLTLATPGWAQPPVPEAPSAAPTPAPAPTATTEKSPAAPLPSVATPAAAPASAVPTPFGPGATVEVTSSGSAVNVYVAKATGGVLADTDFVKVGKTPITFQLPPGSYRIEVEGIDVSNQGMLLEMRSEPKRLTVKTGSEGMGTTGTLLTAVGILGVLAATVILVSGSKAPSKLDKTTVLVPMYIAGGVLLGAGIGMTIASQTKLEEQKSATPPRTAWIGLSGRF